jgi:outer membrane protein TolC
MSGCLSPKSAEKSEGDLAHYQHVVTQIEYPTVPVPCDENVLRTPPPRTMRDLSNVQYRDLSLQDAIQIALSKSRVLLDLGGTILQAPETVPTSYDIAVQETDPQLGPEAALSAFDAQFATSFYAAKNQQIMNNQAIGNAGIWWQYNDVLQAEISKRTADGTQFTIQHIINFARDSNVGNVYPGGAFDTVIQGEMRHPLLQGGGLEFNRIAGPGARPGVSNGVLVARIRTDVSIADFQRGLRDFVSNVENAYWDLYFAYRDLDIRIKARNDALSLWQLINALHAADKRGGEAEKEAQAREQYFRFEEDVQNSLVGQLLEGTRTNDGSAPGTFRGLPGVQVAERRLRLLMGLPATDAELLRPCDEPAMAKISFNWANITCEALTQREELRRQRWVVKGRELECVAAKNFLRPNLDLVGRYDIRGFGKELISSDPVIKPPFDTSSYSSLADGQSQEWQVGLEFSMPLGFRQGHMALHNAELQLTHARVVLREQERQVIHDLSEAVSEVDRAYTLLGTDINRVRAAQDQLEALRAVYKEKLEGFFEVLDAQRRYADALTRYYESRVEYTLAIRNVHYQKGSLLAYCDVALSEGGWPDKAYEDALRRERLRGKPKPLDYVIRKAMVVSTGSEPCADAEAAAAPSPPPSASPDAPASPAAQPAGGGDLPQPPRPSAAEIPAKTTAGLAVQQPPAATALLDGSDRRVPLVDQHP